jgi:hypothetical protein
LYWSGLVSDQFFFNHSFFYPFTGADDSGAVTLQDNSFLLCPAIAATQYRLSLSIKWIVHPSDSEGGKVLAHTGTFGFGFHLLI